MTESKLFLSSCDRRELTRRRGRSPLASLARGLTHPAGFALALLVVCAAGFLAGHGGI